jgi:hypothetical protein
MVELLSVSNAQPASAEDWQAPPKIGRQPALFGSGVNVGFCCFLINQISGLQICARHAPKLADEKSEGTVQSDRAVN